MTRSRIESLVAIARRIADPGDPLGRRARRALVREAGLSPEGIDLALRDHLETHPTPTEIDTLLARATPSRRCHVILSANVCTAALRAIACALATAPHVSIRPSRRAPTLATLLTDTLADPTVTLNAAHPREGEEVAADPLHSSSRAGGASHDFEKNDDFVTRLGAGDALHLYGSDETIAAITARVSPSVAVAAHGTGVGVAIVAADHDAAAGAVADDLVAFDGRGCLSPRVILVARDPLGFAAKLHDALTARGARVPRGVLTPSERAELTRYRDTLRAVGHHFEGAHHAVAVDPAPVAIALPPAHRAAIVLPADAHPLVDPALVVAVGSDQLPHPIAQRFGRARASALGRMQKPPLDGPVDLRHARETKAC